MIPYLSTGIAGALNGRASERHGRRGESTVAHLSLHRAQKSQS